MRIASIVAAFLVLGALGGGVTSVTAAPETVHHRAVASAPSMSALFAPEDNHGNG
ncbi:hypothetical protein [Streptomyces sp. NPDC048442]|uniref:hypothetical protein n=1 Tax=Streptomyces sp. NPDC048442 TaxID=3154823 RepID=UPI00341F99CB